MNQWKYIKENVKDTDLQQFEQLVAIKFDTDLKAFILSHNNGRPSLKQFDSLSSKGLIFDKLLSFNKSDIENVFETYDSLKGALPSHLVAIGLDPFGNYICLDKNNNKVSFWENETNSVQETEMTLLELFKSLY